MPVKEQLKFASNPDLDFESAQSVSDHLLRSEFETWTSTMQTNVAYVYSSVFSSSKLIQVIDRPTL